MVSPQIITSALEFLREIFIGQRVNQDKKLTRSVRLLVAALIFTIASGGYVVWSMFEVLYKQQVLITELKTEALKVNDLETQLFVATRLNEFLRDVSRMCLPDSNIDTFVSNAQRDIGAAIGAPTKPPPKTPIPQKAAPNLPAPPRSEDEKEK